MRRKSISAPDLCEILDSELSLQKIPPLNYLDKKANQKLLSEPSVTNIRRAGENEFVMIVVDHIPEEITESTDS